MKGLAAIILFLLCHCISLAQEKSIYQNLDEYRGLEPDSLKVVLREILDNPSSYDQEIITKSSLIVTSSFVEFNRFEEADSVLHLIQFNNELSAEYLDYLILRGRVLNKQNDNNKALKFFYRALDKTENPFLEQKIPEIYLEIANVLRENNDVENSLKYFNFALEKAQEQENVELQINACIQLCKAYNGWVTLNIDSSVSYGEKAIALSEQHNNERLYAKSIAMVAAPIIRDGQLRRGLDMSREALGYADRYNFSLITRYYLIANQGFAFEGLKMYDSALFFMERAGEIRPESLDYPRLKYRVFKAQGRLKEALEAFEDYHDKSSGIQKKRNTSKLSSLQARYEADLKEQEVVSLTQVAHLQEMKLTQQRYLLGSLVVILVFMFSGGILLVRQRRLKEKQWHTNLELEETKKRLELEQQFRASELKALRSQMNPHFVFNALNSIQEYIITNEKKLAGKYLGKFADLMRVYLNHSQEKSVTIGEELNAINLYLELEKLRFENSLTYSVTVSKDVDHNYLIPSFLTQPYVENAIKHGLFHKKDERKLTINLKIGEDNSLIYTIEDNGIGREKSKEINQLRVDHKSFALSATRSRLELLNEERERPISEQIIDLKDEEGRPVGTRVIINIPLEANS